jgi:protein phosphatase
VTTRCRSAGRTETGKVRSRNEDAILVCEDLGLWAVADGLGGHCAGDYASALIVERLGALTREGSVFDFIAAIEDGLQQVNIELREAAAARRADMIGSTVALLVHDPRFMLCGWVGDSRVYVQESGGVLTQLTRDHVEGHPDDVTHFGRSAQAGAGAGLLTRAVGADETLYFDWAVAGSRPGMQFLLCSDGVNKELSDRELTVACREPHSPDQQIERLFELALARRARDNISAVIVRLDAGAGTSADEQPVNEALRALDEAHRLQQIQRNEYRQRRRALLESLGRDAAGAGDTVRRAAPFGIAHPTGVLPKDRDNGGAQRVDGEAAAAATRPHFGVRSLAACIVLLGAAAAGFMLLCWFSSCS